MIVESGARDAVESMINEYYERALKALHDTEITEEGRTGLTALADAAVRASSSGFLTELAARDLDAGSDNAWKVYRSIAGSAFQAARSLLLSR